MRSKLAKKLNEDHTKKRQLKKELKEMRSQWIEARDEVYELKKLQESMKDEQILIDNTMKDQLKILENHNTRITSSEDKQSIKDA